MKSVSYQTPFSKAFMTGLFVGIVCTFVCLTYNLIYRSETGFAVNDIINVGSIIFGVNILFMVIGLIYYWLKKMFGRGEVVFIILFSLLTIFLVWEAEGVRRSGNDVVNVQFRDLLLGLVLITGVGASFLIPFLFHSKGFEKSIL